MPRTPNYNHERKERDRLKAAKKAEKLALKKAKKSEEATEAPASDDGNEPASR